MAKPVYLRLKVEEKAGRRYVRVNGVGAPKHWIREAVRHAEANGGGFMFRLSDSNWSQHYPTQKAAEEAAKFAPKVNKTESGALVEAPDPTMGTTIRAAVETYLAAGRAAMLRRRSMKLYETTLNHLLNALPTHVRFVKQLATQPVLSEYLGNLVKEEYAPKTISTRMTVIAAMLGNYRKETDVDVILGKKGLVKLPRHVNKRAKAYSKEEIGKLFSFMSPEEKARYTFFLHTGAREGEVMHATWDDIDLEKRIFTVTGEGKDEFWEGPKSYEARPIHFTPELGQILKARKAQIGKRGHDGNLIVSAGPRWIFVNRDGEPDGHMLRRFKAVAKKAGLNCGYCKSTRMEGAFTNRHEVTASCADRPICEKHYLHRLRKTAATQWLRAGIDLMNIMEMLGHQDLKTTQIYLSDEMAPDIQKKVAKAFAA